jgi:hypothetical protein
MGEAEACGSKGWRGKVRIRNPASLAWCQERLAVQRHILTPTPHRHDLGRTHPH